MGNNNNGRGIFYGVIGVATLVVAIIGATFAYFSASISGYNNIVVESTEIDLQWGGEVLTGLKTDMIPIDTDAAGAGPEGNKDTNNYEAAFAAVVGIGADDCKDNVGNEICSVYQFTISNPSTTAAQTVYGHISALENNFTDMYYAVFVGDAATLKTKGKFTVHGTESTAEQIFAGTDKVGLIHKAANTTTLAETTNSTARADWTWLSNSTKLLNPKGKGTATLPDSITYTVVVWLEESYSNQESQEGETFTASVMFNTGDGQGVTGQLTAGQ